MATTKPTPTQFRLAARCRLAVHEGRATRAWALARLERFGLAPSVARQLMDAHVIETPTKADSVTTDAGTWTSYVLRTGRRVRVFVPNK